MTTFIMTGMEDFVTLVDIITVFHRHRSRAKSEKYIVIIQHKHSLLLTVQAKT